MSVRSGLAKPWIKFPLDPEKMLKSCTKTPIHCFVCSLDISQYDLAAQESHVNACLDMEAASSTNRDARKDPALSHDDFMPDMGHTFYVQNLLPVPASPPVLFDKNELKLAKALSKSTKPKYISKEEKRQQMLLQSDILPALEAQNAVLASVDNLLFQHSNQQPMKTPPFKPRRKNAQAQASLVDYWKLARSLGDGVDAVMTDVLELIQKAEQIVMPSGQDSHNQEFLDRSHSLRRHVTEHFQWIAALTPSISSLASQINEISLETPPSTSDVPLDVRIRSFIMADVQSYRRILRFETIDMLQLQKSLKASHISVSKANLKSCLDSMGVFYSEGGLSSWKRKKSKSTVE